MAEEGEENDGPAAPPAPRPGAEAAMRRHRERYAFLARRRGAPLPAAAVEAKGGGGAEVKVEVKAEAAEEVEICKLERAVEAAEGKSAAAGAGRKRRREGDGAAEAGPSGGGAGGQRLPGNAGRKTSRFQGVSKANGGRGAKPWLAKIKVTEDGKQRQIHIGTFSREEDAARAYDRVSIAYHGHAKAKTNFPVAQYRAEWAELEALGVDGAVALMKEHAAAERPDVMNKGSRFRGVYKVNGGKGPKPWTAQISATKNSKPRVIYIGSFAKEEDAARAYDRVSIAKLGHAKAETNFPVADYRAEWAELEALGVDGAAALMKEHAAAERPDVMNKVSRFRGVYKVKGGKAKPWVAQIGITEDGKLRKIHIGTFAREEDAARAFDRVSIAKLGHAQAKTNFPVAEYRAEWAELEALGVDGAAARERRRAKAM